MKLGATAQTVHAFCSELWSVCSSSVHCQLHETCCHLSWYSCYHQLVDGHIGMFICWLLNVSYADRCSQPASHVASTMCMLRGTGVSRFSNSVRLLLLASDEIVLAQGVTVAWLLWLMSSLHRVSRHIPLCCFSTSGVVYTITVASCLPVLLSYQCRTVHADSTLLRMLILAL